MRSRDTEPKKGYDPNFRTPHPVLINHGDHLSSDVILDILTAIHNEIAYLAPVPREY